MSINNPDWFKKGVKVVPSKKAKEQTLWRKGAQGIVTSRFPIYQTVTVQWDYKKSRDRVYIDLLEIVHDQSPPSSINMWDE